MVMTRVSTVLACVVAVASAARVDDDKSSPMGAHIHHRAVAKHKQPIEVKAQRGDADAILAINDAELAAEMTNVSLPVVPPEEVEASAKSDETIAFLDAEARAADAVKLEGAKEEALATAGIAHACDEKVILARNETMDEKQQQYEAKLEYRKEQAEQAQIDEEANENLAMKEAGEAVAHAAHAGLSTAREHKAVADKGVADLTAVAENATADAGMQKSKMEHSYAMEVFQHHALDAAVLAKAEAVKAFQAATTKYDIAHATESKLAPIATGTNIANHAANEKLAISQDKEFALKMVVDHGVDVSEEAMNKHMHALKKAEQEKAEKEMNAKLAALAKASEDKRLALVAERNANMTADAEQKAKEDAAYAQVQRKAAQFQKAGAQA